ncbi:glycosyltransferase family 2 protein [Methylobacillus sp. Pita1]|uniref:glycosyltransferase family 2 protein n=1 Tax=Methylobacillus sp. Pita1 TaxID=3382642 RepID=UPI0038B64313
MKISIITVCYNSAATIADTIASVASQQYSNREHIVVDGASQDNTMEIVKGAPSVTQYVSELDQGIYDAMNKGLKLATGDVVGLLNADDFYADDTVLDQVAEVFKDPDVQACYADLLYVDQSDTSRVIRYWKSRDFEAGLFKRGWMPAHPTFFVRRSVYESLGGFDLRFPRQADFELTMRFLEVHGIRSVYVPRVWIRMRVGGASNNSIRGVIKGNLEAYRACKLHGLNVGPLFIPRKVFSRLPQFFIKPHIDNTN